MTIQELAENSPNIEILNSWLVTDNKLKRCRKALVAISGGSDSDIVLHLCATLDTKGKATYVFFDTGLEFQATKNHIKRLEEKYGIKIEVKKAVKPIPTCCREYGVPFLSKRVSDYISRLQKHNFKWEDRPFEELIKEYPTCKGALMWWCNTSGEGSRFNISRNKWLKEFIVANPPQFKISDKYPFTKKTCLWLKGLPELVPTNKVMPEKGRIIQRHDGTTRYSCWCMDQGKPFGGEDRARLRAKTFPGIAKAMAEQWG